MSTPPKPGTAPASSSWFLVGDEGIRDSFPTKNQPAFVLVAVFGCQDQVQGPILGTEFLPLNRGFRMWVVL